jgi:hypothetical protein
MASYARLHPNGPVNELGVARFAMKKIGVSIAAAAIAVTMTGCGETTGSRTLSGGAMGAAGGAALGAIGGNAGLGAVVGAGAGLLGGYLYDQHQKGNID